jgi:hypothetical protein
MKKRSQVTLFVIIGLVILISALVIIYIKYLIKPPEKIETPGDPVQMFVEQCIKSSAEEGLVMLGQQGGYINTEAIDAQSARLDPFGSPALAQGGGKLIIPYWFYQDSAGMDRSEMPALVKSYDGDYSIQWQLEDYINRNVRDCIDGFSVFKPQGIDVTEAGVLNTSVIIGDAAVSIKVLYPIDVTEKESAKRLKEFYVTVPVRLGSVYGLARDIRDYEMSDIFLERNTMNLISLYSRIDSEYLPPMYGGLQFEPCTKRVYWMYPDVERDFREVLTANVPFMKVKDTMYEPIKVTGATGEELQIRQGIYDGMVHKVSDSYYPFMSVDFSFQDSFPLQMDFGGYGLIEPNSFEIDMVFAQVCMFEYKFTYNMKYPVMVSIRDQQSKVDNQEFMFQFPMQVVLKDNFPRVRYSDMLPPDSRTIVKSECDPGQRLSGNVSVSATDRSNNGIDQAAIYFQCGPSFVYKFGPNETVEKITPFADRCYIGATDQGLFKGPFPQCSGGGLLTVSKPGYVSRTEVVGDTVAGKDRKISMSLDKVYDLDLAVKKYFVKPARGQDSDLPGIVVDDHGDVTQCNIRDSASQLQSYEQAIVRLTRIDEAQGMRPVVAFYSPLNQTTVGIAPGTYQVDIMLIRNERFNNEMTIRKGSESITVSDGLSADKTVEYPDKDVLLPVVFSGGASFNWTVTDAQLNKAKSVIFHVIDEGIPKQIEEVSLPLKHRQACSELNSGMMMPEVGR